MQLFKYILTLSVLTAIAGCSVKKNTWLSRNYHILNSYYNVYYNGREAFDEGMKSIAEGEDIDYTSLLPIYTESDKEKASKASAQMERAIEKGKKLIEKHSITAKPKRKSGKTSEKYKAFTRKSEFNPMVDDAWLLIGKAHSVKHDDMDAVSVLEYIIREHGDTPSKYEASIWLAKTYTNAEQYVNAQATLEGYDLDGEAPESLYPDYMAAYANMLIAKTQYAEAIPYMEKAAANIANKTKYYRYNYILAQLYQMKGRNNDAYNAYSKALKNNPDYVMGFNARISMAAVSDGKTGVAETEKALVKLSKDKKNKEYLDQIYYALGNLKLNANDRNGAIAQLKKSITHSTSNNNQKGLSFTTLGDIYYQMPQYIEAYEAYDSAMVFVNEQSSRYRQLSERHSHLAELSANLMTIRIQDSLLMLASLSQSERDKRIDAILENQKREIEKQQQASSTYFGDTFFQNDLYTQNQQGTKAGAKWYFYNVQIVGAGKMEFERSWGKRKNEDNWRRSNKSSVAEEDSYREPGMDMDNEKIADQPDRKNQTASADSTKQQPKPSVATRESLLADIPLTDEAKKKSKKKIEEALFESAGQLLNTLSDHKSAAQQYERLLAEYPSTETRENALTGLYQAYAKLNDTANMARVKGIITNDYPASMFARYLNDPQFMEKLAERRADIEKHYEETYSQYLTGNFDQVIARDSQKPDGTDNPYSAKYTLLKALSYAKLGEATPFAATLTSLVSTYKGSEEAKIATMLLSEIEKGRQPVKAAPFKSALAQKQDAASGAEQAGVEGPTFVYSPYEAHTVFVVTDKKTNINQLQYGIADFNFGRFLLSDYSVELRTLSDGTMLLMVGGLKNKIEALDYLYTIREQHALMQRAGLDAPEIMVISNNNIKELVTKDGLKPYSVFFNAYYMTVVKEPEKPAVKPLEKPVSEQPKTADDKPMTEHNQPTVKEEAKTTSENIRPEKSDKEEFQEKTNDTEKPEEPQPQLFMADDNSGFAAVILIRKGRTDLKRAQTIITNHTINNYGEDIKGEAADMGNTHRVIKVTGFYDKEAAQQYLDKLKSGSSIMTLLGGPENHLFVITETNYKLLMENKKIQEYKSFIGK